VGSALTTAAPTDKQGPQAAPAGQPSKRCSIGPQTRLGQVRERVAARRGRNIGVVAAARELVCLAYYGLRDGHIRRLTA
jgi:hypothetical protein